MYDYYITPKEYEIAEKNGISQSHVNKRVRCLGWRKQRAITQPIRKQTNEIKTYVPIAEKNGISETTFRRRIERGWDIITAMNTPLYTQEEKIKKMIANQPKRNKKVKKKPKENVFRKLNAMDFERMKRIE